MTKPRFGRVFAVLAASLPLAACSVATPPRLAQAEPAVSLPSKVHIAGLPEGEAATDLGNVFGSAVWRALLQQGVAHDEQSAYRLTTAIVERPAALGVTQLKTGTPGAGDWISEPRAHHWYDGCRAKRIEATVVLTGPGNVERPAMARGAFDACSADKAKVEELARILVAALRKG